MTKVKVWRFSKYHIVSSENEVSPRYATTEFIERERCSKIAGSNIEVDIAELDANGSNAAKLAKGKR